jgi:prepilin-type N-terminal cleavage/methylation domain-containing protein/prepilin-type processing-associated H-X9-DG protein
MSRRAFTLIELLTAIAILAVLAAILFPVFSRVREAGRSTACLSNLKQIGSAVAMYVSDHAETYPMSRFPDATHPMTGCTAEDTNYPVDGLHGTSHNWKRAIEPYVKSRDVYRCPSNAHAWDRGGYNDAPGDETNVHHPGAPLANSYAVNGSFFHEAVPACWYGEPWERPRAAAEISQTSRLIFLLESRYSFPDLGGWYIPQRGPNQGSEGPFQTHNGMPNWLFADLHAKRVKLPATCTERMWTDTYPDWAGGCERIHEMADEYR